MADVDCQIIPRTGQEKQWSLKRKAKGKDIHTYDVKLDLIHT